MWNPVSITGLLVIAIALVSCDGGSWNNPYPASQTGKNILYSSFEKRPKHLDPVQSYSSNEYQFIGQIYEPPLQYHYLKRPYQLEVLTAEAMPQPVYLDKDGNQLDENGPVEDIAYSVYEISIKPGIMYQPHPAFARNEAGEHYYQNLQLTDLEKVETLADFKHTGTRELTASDYVYQIKRLGHPQLHSPIFSLMSEYIVGLKEYSEALKKVQLQNTNDDGKNPYLDLSRYPLKGVELVDKYTYRITVNGKYPQLLYWLAMPFFAPIPPEADRFYSQPGMKEKNISFDWYPVGTGAYMLTVNNPNRKMVLDRNPNYHGSFYPMDGDPEDKLQGLLEDAGKKLPFIDKVIYSLEKESIPYWSKFLQGFYDTSGIPSDSFDKAVQFSAQGEAELTGSMRDKQIKLITEIQATTSYMGFNMLDPVVGGDGEPARKIRRAISIAVNYEDFVSIFRNGRGIPSQGPVPPGIFGYMEGKDGINPYVYDWVNGKPVRKSIAVAKQLLADAGYPNGRNQKDGKPLILHLDITGGGAEDKSFFDWLRKQFKKINLDLDIRNTDYNRFQEKMRKGNAQVYMWGWNADYPDPENFLFLLYGPNAKAIHAGENASNYQNPEFDRLFDQMKNMTSSPERLQIIRDLVDIARRDAPWLWGFHSKQFILHHDWYKNVKPNLMAHNTLQYKRIDSEQRDKLRKQWNKPIIWPIVVLLIVFILSVVPAVVTYLRKEHASR